MKIINNILIFRRKEKMEETIMYVLIENELMNEDNISYISYGICAYSFEDGCYKKVDEIKDISVQRRLVQDMVEKFNRLKLSKVHFREWVLDNI